MATLFFLVPVQAQAETITPDETDEYYIPDLSEEELENLKHILEEENAPDFINEVPEMDFKSFSSTSEYDSISLLGERISLDTNSEDFQNYNNFNDEFSLLLNPDGREPRYRINNTLTSPYNNQARLAILRYDGSGGSCSATFITPNHVVTAAHCIYDPYVRTFHQGFAVIPGENDLSHPYGSRAVTNGWVPSTWTGTTPDQPGMIALGDVRHDYAVLKINGSHGHTSNYNVFPTGTNNLVSYGYPGNEAISSGNGTRWFSFRAPGYVQGLAYGAIVHNSDVTSVLFIRYLGSLPSGFNNNENSSLKLL
ncbi:MAG: trypsin-like serine protease [Rickettsia endosymbiont of Ixodes persulcatus]|nr:trypsin-like serine protease [Rickettsia endosymbiont of Ixodes persulcatus]